MKNIIKRGTSLLLVLAMLLSFAAVVGAEEPTTTTSEKILTLTVEDAVVKAGETTYIPAYVQGSTDNIIMSMNLSAISENSAVQITGVYPAKPLRWDGDDWEYDESTKGVLTLSGATAAAPETKKPLLTWAVSKKKDGFTATAEKQLLCYIEVLATETTTAQVSLCAKPGAEESMFATYVEGAHVDSHSKNKVEFISGTAVVIPADASLPTVILTQSSFAAPTMATYDPEQGVDLLNYLKIVDKDGNLHDASSAADTSITGNYVSNGALKLMPTSGNSGKILVNNLHAADDENITASATLTYTVTKDTVRTPWKAGFSTYNGKYKTQADFDADFAKNPPKAPVYNGGAEHNSTSVYPNVFDQYGEVMDGYSFVPLVTLYNAADHTTPLANEAGNADPAYSAVHFNYNQTTGKWASDTLYYTKELKKDVWCKIELGVIDPDGEKANIPADTLEFLIQSQYPQAASATVVLGDMNGNEFPSGPVTTIDIPYGPTENKTFSIIVKDFRQADGKTMPEGTEPSATDVTIALDGTYTGVSISNGNKLVIDKTAQAGTVTVKATLNGKTLGTLPLTLQKAASVVTELKLYDRATGKPKDGTKIEIKSGVTNGKATLPGIRANDELVLEFEPVCAIDQYGDIVQTKHAEDGGYANRDYLSALDYVLYKYDETAKEYKTFTTNVVRTVDTTTGVLKLTLKNELDKDTNELLIPEGKYCLKTWANSFPDCKTMLSSAEFELVKGASVYDTLEVTADRESVAVPYLYGTDAQRASQYLTLTVNAKDQYGRAIDASKITDLALDESTVWVGGNAIGGILPVAKDQHTTTASNVLRLEVKPSAGENMKTNLTADLEVALTFKVDGTAKRIERTKVTTLTKDESVLSTAAVRVGETAGNWNVVDFYSNVMLAKKEQTVNLIAPKDATKSYKISILNCDQYGTKLDGQQYEVTAPEDGSIAIVDQTYTHDDLTVTTAAANKELVISFPNAATPTWKVTIKVVPMEFVKSETGKNDTFKLGDYLTNDTFSAEYNGQPWSTILAKKDGAKVYIKTAEVNNTLIDDGKLSLEVTKDGSPVGMDAKANAGTYKVKLVYTDEKGQKYTVDEKTFTITKKTVTIKTSEIIKNYDGSDKISVSVQNPLKVDGVVNGENVEVNAENLRYESVDASDTPINIVARKDNAGNDLNCLVGADADNYTARIAGLTGKITKRTIVVTPKSSDEVNLTYGDDVAEKLASEYTTNINELPTTCVAPTIEGSMKLTDTTSGADVAVYNAGTYNVANKDLSAGTNYVIEFPATSVQWTINRKLLTKVKNDGLPNSAFGAITDEGIIDVVWNGSVTVVNGEAIEAVNVSKIVSKDKLSFPADTEYFTTGSGATEKKYPMPGKGERKTYTLVVTNPGTVEVGENYYVNKDTVYEFQYTVLPIGASSLNVNLTTADGSAYTENTYTYNGTEQGPQVQVTYEVRTKTETVTLDLTSISNISATQAINAATYTINVTAPTVATGTQTATWKINPKNINGEDIEVVLQDLYYTGEYVDLCDAVVKLRDKTLDVDLVKGVDWDFAGACGTTNAGESQTVRIYGKGNYGIPNNYRAFTVTLQKAGAALDDTQLEGKQATRNKTNVIELSPKYKLAENPTIEVVGSSEWLDNSSVSAEYKDGKIKITLNVKDGPVTETSKVRLKLTIVGTNNYEETVKEFDVKIIEKLVQNFTIAPATGDRAYSYSEGSVQMVATNAVGTVRWQIATDTSGGTAKIDSNGKLELGHPGTVKVVATANETDAYAAASQTYVLTITKGQVMITASSATMTANDPLPGFSATASGLNPNDSVSEVFQTLTASAGTDGKTAGTFRVTPNATFKTGGRKNWSECYDLYFVAGTLTVNPAVSVIDTVLPTIIAGNGCANGYANCACESFYDLDASRWYHEAIDWAYSLGLMNGTTKSTFGPNAAATRAQTWTMLARIAGQDTRRSSTWYEVGQKWAMNLGITDGTNPMGSLTREQLAAMLYRYVGSPAVNGTLTFTDSANVSTWARNAMIWAVQNGILDGVGGNRLNPKGTTTRAQAAAIFMRFSKLINK